MSRTLTPADEMMMVRWSVEMKQKISVTDIAHVPSVELRSGIWERSRKLVDQGRCRRRRHQPRRLRVPEHEAGADRQGQRQDG
jgi:hypothetical protein